MNIKNDNILIIGAGNMGYAFISALIENKVSPKKSWMRAVTDCSGFSNVPS